MPTRPLALSHGVKDAPTQAAIRQLEQLIGQLSATTTTVALFTRTTDGTVPAPGGSGTARYLREDGTWTAPAGVTLPIAESDVTGLVSDLAAKAPATRNINTSAGELTGGGDLSADRTLGLANTAVTPGSYVLANITVDQKGRVTAASSTSLSFGVGMYGDGSDGTVTASSTTLSRDMFYDALTVPLGVTLNSGGYRIFVRGVLTLNGVIANNGGGGSGGTGGSASAAGFLGGGGAGGAGANGSAPATGGGNSTLAPTEFASGSAAGGSNSAGANGGVGQGGGGGDKSGAGGGASGVTTRTTSLQGTRDILVAIQGRAFFASNGALTTATGGGGGRGDGFVGIGGGGGGGGGWVVVCARTITGSGSIQAKGGNGANGVSNDGGGGGGGGGGIVVVVTDSTSVPTVDVSGGTGGAPSGAGFSGGHGGSGLAITYHL